MLIFAFKHTKLYLCFGRGKISPVVADILFRIIYCGYS